MTEASPVPQSVLGGVLFAIAAVLLTSVGGLGIAAAPVILPLLFLSCWATPPEHSRFAGAVIGGLTAAELTWGLVYLLAGEVPLVSWLAPITAGMSTGFALATVGRGKGSSA